MSEQQKSVKLGEIIQEFNLEILRTAPDYENVPLRALDINRPGLPLTGFFEHFDTERLLLIGLTEHTYLSDLTPEQRRERFDRLLAYPVPALILTRGLEAYPECLEMADKHGRTVLRSTQRTAVFMSSLISSLYSHLAPQITQSGVMLEVYGEGILIQGESGVGKSEVAIELLKRGHRLVADDAVEIRHIGTRLVGSAPELIRHYIELRGIGIVDVQQLFGMSSVREEKNLDLVVNLEPWNDNTFYDRMGTNEEFTTILDMKIPSITIPVKPGRNLAIIIEVAAMNNRHRKLGYNAAQELYTRVQNSFARNRDEDEW